MAKNSPRPRSGNPAKGRDLPPPKATLGSWIAAARPRTLSLSIAPVALGTGAGLPASGSLDAAGQVHWDALGTFLCLGVALFLQIGVNYANDYSDGIRGTDAFRVGPPRLTGSGIVPPRRVLGVALGFFAAAAAAGLAVTILTQQWWFLAVGAAAIAAAWFYSGGKRPYGYYGLGELSVFIFFGLVATLGTAYVQSPNLTVESWVGGIALGLIACAVLMANNLRDIDTDRAAGKRTLAVLVGPVVSRVLFGVFLLLPFIGVFLYATLYPKAVITFFVLLAALPAVLIVATAKTPREFVIALQLASLTSLGYGVLLGLGIAF